MNWTLLQNSLLVASATALASAGLGILGALWLNGVRPVWRRTVLAIAVLGLALPPFLVTNAWLDLAGQTGVLRPWLPVSIYSLGGTVWVLGLLLWPITLLLVLGALQKIQPSQLEVDPALRGWPLIRWLVLPMIGPALAQAGVLTFVLAFNNFAVPAILQTKVYPAEIWVSFNTTFDYQSVWMLSLPLWVLPALLILFLHRAPVQWPRVEGAVAASLFRQRLGKPWFAAAAVTAGSALILAVAMPLGQLLLSARTWMELPAAFAAGRQAVLNSFAFAALAASFCALAGTMLWRWRAGALFWLIFLLPGVLLGIGLIYVANRPVFVALYQSAGIVVLALGLRYLALSWTGARRAMQSTDPNLADFARLNGATRWQLFRYAQWPQVAPVFAAVWFITYLLCLWDVETLVMIIPPGCETLALRTFNLLHYGHNVQVNALCLLLLGLAVLPIVGWSLFGSRLAGTIGASNLALGVLAGSLLAGSGCQPAPSNQAQIQSKLFNRVQVIGSRGAGLGQFNKPRSLAVDAEDNVYVVDMTGRVQKFSPDGEFLAFWQMPQTDIGKPKGMCRDSAGGVVVIEPHYARVNHFSPEGKLLEQWGKPGTNDGWLCLPRAVAIGRNGDLFVCEYTLVDRVQVFAARDKQWKLAFGKPGRGEGEFNRPEGLAVDSANRVYVADSCNHRVQVFSVEGQFLRSYGQPGSGRGEMSYPYDVQVDAAGWQFVCEFGNSRVQIFDAEGKVAEILGGAGAAPGQFSNPWSMALDSTGNLYVADSQNHRVQKFIRRTPLMSGGSSRLEGATPAQSFAELARPALPREKHGP